MKLFVFTGLVAAALCFAQEKPPAAAAAAAGPDPSAELRQSLGEAGGSPIEVTRALERFLQKYPTAAERDDVENALAKIAMEQRDNARIILYGEKVLARDPGNMQLLDRVPRALLATDDMTTAARALPLARQFEAGIHKLEKEQPPAGREAGKMREELDKGLARAYLYQAKAVGILGKPNDAIPLAERSFATYPTAEAAREAGTWLARTGKPLEAVRFYAEAFTIPDTRLTDAERAADRRKAGELYQQAKGSTVGLGDIVLEAYDLTTAAVAKRRALLESTDVNGAAKKPLEFTLTSVDGSPLPLASLRGKVIVMDFWATWCGPCRQQHPLYEQVKQRFKDQPNVVFLAVSADEDRSAVKPFLEEQKWTNKIYYEDGLSSLMQVSSLPTTLIFDKRGELVSRLNGFVPDRFVDMLSERIQEALK